MKISPATSGAAGLWRRLRPERARQRVAHYEGVLGTSCEIHVVSASAAAIRRARAAALAEIDRLAAVFSTYAPSEFSRWQESQGEPIPVSPELGLLLHESERWRERTGGAFNPAVEALTRLWSRASATGDLPRDSEIEALLPLLAAPLWSVEDDGSTARRLTKLPASLDAFAKGYIIDRATAAAAAVPKVRGLIVNIGGDLRHIGNGTVPVGVADPFAHADNLPPAHVVAIRGEAMATSGGYRRGFRIGDRWHSHLLDPRTGRPASGVASASVVAPDAATADVLATAFSILPPPESVARADSLGVSCLLVTQQGARISNAAWDARVLRDRAHEEIA